MDKEKSEVDEERSEPTVTEESDKGADTDSNEKESRRGEGDGNLRRRSDWFQKRHGGG